ncbi:hypothetical protein V493_01650, partial [Pseudogymnoascus sp. VKM F-4281 (FW-2241)]
MDTKSSRTRKTAQKPAHKAANKEEAKTVQKPAHKATNKEEAKPAPSPEPPQTLLVDNEEVNLIDIRATGDILLDITFTNSHSTRTILALNSALPPRLSPFSKPGLPSDRTLFRVRLDTLTKTSAYFSRLLTDARFQEATKLTSSFAALALRGVVPAEAQPADLPRVAITDDDDATQVAGRSPILADLLRILHSGDATSKLSIPYLAVLALMADRFDCAATIGSEFCGRGAVEAEGVGGVVVGGSGQVCGGDEGPSSIFVEPAFFIPSHLFSLTSYVSIRLATGNSMRRITQSLRQEPRALWVANKAHPRAGLHPGDAGIRSRHRPRELEGRAAEHVVGECGDVRTIPVDKERDDGFSAQARGFPDVERFVKEILRGRQLGLDARGMRHSARVRVIIGAKGGKPQGNERHNTQERLLHSKFTLVANSYHPTILMSPPPNNRTPLWQSNASILSQYEHADYPVRAPGDNIIPTRQPDIDFRRHYNPSQLHAPIPLPDISTPTSSPSMFSSLKASLRRKKSNLSTSSRNSWNSADERDGI